MKRGFVCLLAALVLVPFLALAVSAAIDPSPYLNDSGYRVTLGGFQRTFEEHLRPGADHSYVTNIKIENTMKKSRISSISRNKGSRSTSRS
ncbi:MAG: hypothetical protein IJR89_07675 [Clostridia bacterium]|nr:hypothetical protein [Clostridia bacterium]